MSDPRPNPPKPSRRKSGANRLDPIDWHEYANDAVLNGNMSTLFHRPPTEDPTAYASPEALVEIEKRVRAGHAAPSAVPAQTGARTQGQGLRTGASSGASNVVAFPPAGESSAAAAPDAAAPMIPRAVPAAPAASAPPAVSTAPAASAAPAVSTAGTRPTGAPAPTVGFAKNKRVKPIREVHDALTLAGQILYKAMYGPAAGTGPRECAKGYRQLAAETHLDKDTVRDLIADFKDKGMLRETGSYNPDTRSPKTYEVLPGDAILQHWRDAGFFFVTSGRQRPEFCSPQGEPYRS